VTLIIIIIIIIIIIMIIIVITTLFILQKIDQLKLNIKTAGINLSYDNPNKPFVQI